MTSYASLERRVKALEAAREPVAMSIPVVYIDEEGREVGRAGPEPVTPGRYVDYRLTIAEGHDTPICWRP